MSWDTLLITAAKQQETKFSSSPNLLQFLILSLSWHSKISLWVKLLGGLLTFPKEKQI